jgi:hypothetical protein
MNTGIRRFLLRLIVGLLAFVAGVSAATLLGGFRPFQSFESSPSYRHRNYEYYRSRTATLEPAFEYHEYHEHGCRMRSRLSEPPPPPPVP